ncbi:hypothetical protein SCOR_03145 [Sulfidibacter corallicola]
MRCLVGLIPDRLWAFTQKNDNPFSFTTCLGTTLPLVWDGRSPTTKVIELFFHLIAIFGSDVFSESNAPHIPANLTTIFEPAHHTSNPRFMELESWSAPRPHTPNPPGHSTPSHTMKPSSSSAKPSLLAHRRNGAFRLSWRVPCQHVTWGGASVPIGFGRRESGHPSHPKQVPHMRPPS